MASSIGELNREITARMNAAMIVAKNRIEKDVKQEVKTFYNSPTPKVYQRTHLLENSPQTTGVTGAFVKRFDVYLQPQPWIVPNPLFGSSYFSGQQVLEAAENSTSGVIGRGGFWDRSLTKMPLFISESFGKFFDFA